MGHVFILLLTLTLSVVHRAASAESEGWTGYSEPVLDSTLAFQSGGIVAKFHVQDGQAVHQGDLLVELDSEQEKLEVERRNLVMEAARKDYERTKQVFETGKSVSRDELEQKEASFKVAEVELRIAKEILRRRQLTAPGDGVLADHFGYDLGEAIQAGTPIVRIVNVAECRFTCHVKGSSQHGLSPTKQVSLEIDVGGATVKVDGVVEFVSPVVDAASGLLVVKARFSNPGGKIPPGLTGRLHLKTT